MAITRQNIDDALNCIGKVGREVIALANRANTDEGQPQIQEAARRLHLATLALESARASLPSVRAEASRYIDECERTV